MIHHRNRNTFIFFLLISIFLLLVSNAHSEVIYQLREPPPPANSPPTIFQNASLSSNFPTHEIEGGELLSISYTKLFFAISALERRNVKKANQLLDEMYDDLVRINHHFIELQSKIPDKNISLKRLTSEELEIIKIDLKPYGGKIPKNFRGLIKITISEMQKFTKLVSGAKFYNDSRINRNTIRRLLEGLNRSMLVGLSISDIEAANRSARGN